MRYRIRILGENDNLEIDDVMGWQTQPEKKRGVPLIDGEMQLGEQKVAALFIDNASFSYVSVREEEVFFVTNTGGEEKTKKICNKGEYRPVALYSDADVSISFDPYRNVLFFSKEETTKIPVGDFLDNVYYGGKFDCVLKEEDGTMYFDIGWGKEIQITPDMKIQESDRKRTTDLLADATCELSDGRVVKFGGIFVKYLN